MKSLKELLILGPGPSSSHTIGPYRICEDFLNITSKYDTLKYKVTLYGSLALTGVGHHTDFVIKNIFTQYNKDVDIIFNYDLNNLKHPNTMMLEAILNDNKIISKRYQSIGGGVFKEEDKLYEVNDVYPFNNFKDLIEYLNKNNICDIYEVIKKLEGEDIFNYAKKLVIHSFKLIEEMINSKCVELPSLGLKTVSSSIYKKSY